MLCHDAMIQERNIDPAECLPQFVGNGLIIGAGKWVAPGWLWAITRALALRLRHSLMISLG